MRRSKILLFSLLLALSAWAPAAADQLKDFPPAPVELDGQELFSIRAGAKAFSPEFRAKLAGERILEVAKDYGVKPEQVTVSELEIAAIISAGEKPIVTILDADAAAEGREKGELAEEYAGKIRQAIKNYREQRSARVIATGLAETLVATLVLIGLIALLQRGVKRGEQAIRERLPVPSLQIASFEFFTADRIKRMLVAVLKVVRLAILLTLIYAYFHLGLSFFPWTRNLALRLLDYVFAALSTMANGVLDQLPGLTFLVVLYFVTRYVLKTLKLFFEQVSQGKISIGEMDAEVAEPTYKIIRLMVIAFALVVAYPYIPGSESSAFKGVSIFVGVIFSLGSTSAIGNIAAGLSLLYMRSYREGDVVKIGDAQGIVLYRKLLVTRVKTFKNEEITVPNSSILSGQVTNYSHQARMEGVILHTSITIGYDAPWRQVHDLLLEAAKASPHILKSPPPFVLQTALNDFYVTYELNAFTDHPQTMPAIYSGLHKNIQDKFNEAGVEIMSPHYSQLRDGSHTTIPEQYLPADYAPSAIRILDTGKAAATSEDGDDKPVRERTGQE
jgi:small-conductance mechanosensitive channel